MCRVWEPVINFCTDQVHLLRAFGGLCLHLFARRPARLLARRDGTQPSGRGCSVRGAGARARSLDRPAALEGVQAAG